jgi:hypothetical protein
MSAEDFEFGDNEEGQFTLVYDNIIKSKGLMPVTRTLALDLSESGYMSVGDFLKSLSDYDVENLLKISEDEDSEQFSEIALIAEMLASGEGLTAFKDIDTFSQRIDQLCAFLAIESLARKGLVKIYYENVSFGEEMGDKIIVEKL